MPTINLGTPKRRDYTIDKRKYQDVYQDRRWKKLRAFKVLNNPICEICESQGKVVQAQEIHHIIPFEIYNEVEDIERLAYDYDNLISLCIEHHKKLHALLNSKAISNTHLNAIEIKKL